MDLMPPAFAGEGHGRFFPRIVSRNRAISVKKIFVSAATARGRSARAVSEQPVEPLLSRPREASYCQQYEDDN